MFLKGFAFLGREEREGREWKKELFLPFSNVFSAKVFFEFFLFFFFEKWFSFLTGFFQRVLSFKPTLSKFFFFVIRFFWFFFAKKKNGGVCKSF